MTKRKTVERLTVETSSVRVDVREVVRNAYVAGARIRDSGEIAAELVHGFFFNASADELAAAATSLRGIAAQVAAMSGELMASAGRLEQIASVYEASGEIAEEV
jgi:hypothetical protein